MYEIYEPDNPFDRTLAKQLFMGLETLEGIKADFPIANNGCACNGSDGLKNMCARHAQVYDNVDAAIYYIKIARKNTINTPAKS